MRPLIARCPVISRDKSDLKRFSSRRKTHPLVGPIAHMQRNTNDKWTRPTKFPSDSNPRERRALISGRRERGRMSKHEIDLWTTFLSLVLSREEGEREQTMCTHSRRTRTRENGRRRPAGHELSLFSCQHRLFDPLLEESESERDGEWSTPNPFTAAHKFSLALASFFFCRTQRQRRRRWESSSLFPLHYPPPPPSFSLRVFRQHPVLQHTRSHWVREREEHERETLCTELYISSRFLQGEHRRCGEKNAFFVRASFDVVFLFSLRIGRWVFLSLASEDQGVAV